ncbi:MAG TPA: GDP-L-fucose synthase [Rhodothermales bacterium]|nr:GDP-L-fucose synthase [Rhodothermales bacterium]HRR10119.1 GDP-L-fucose synthase [Rhodothermales bacterium]
MHLNHSDSKIYVAGHHGLVGSAITRELQNKGYHQVIGRTRATLDLTKQSQVFAFFEKVRPEYVVVAAAKVGGIVANSTYPAMFIGENLEIQNNLIRAAHETGVKRLLFLGSSCIYPKHAPQPLKEEYLLTGPLEPTNEWYAVAKIAGIKLCQAYHHQYGDDFISLMPTNLYGPGDNFDLQNSHVLPALIRKFHEARKNHSPVTLWGTGTVLREFLHSEDLGRACVQVLETPVADIEYVAPERLLNVGTGTDLTIRALAELVNRIVGGNSDMIWDTSKPDGTPRKLLDTTKIQHLGWRPKISLEDGIRHVYEWYKQQNHL